MKIKLISIIVLILTTVNIKDICAQSDVRFLPFTSNNDSVVISGKILGYQVDQKDNFIKIITRDLHGEDIKKAFLVESDGNFEVKVYQPFTGNITINYLNAFVEVLTPPNKQIKLEINNEHNNTISPGDFIAKGSMASVNNTCIKFQEEFQKQAFYKMSNLENSSKSDSIYTAERMLQLQYELKFLGDYVASEQITDRTFIEWQTNELKYIAGHEILFSLFLGKLNKTITTERLISYIKGIPIQNSSALSNGSYYRFLNTLSAGFQIIVNLNPNYEPIKKAQGNNSMAIYLNEFDLYATGISRELLYLNSYPTNKATVASANLLWPRFNKMVQNFVLNKNLNSKRIALTSNFQSYNIFEQIEKEKISDRLKKKLITYFRPYLGKHLYLDFWGDWCQPCLMEMPTYPAVISALEGQEIQFVFFSVMTTEQSMNAIKNKFGINADFIGLNNDEEAVLNNIFNFHSYPAHFILDARGNVITNNLPGGDAVSKAKSIAAIIKKL